MCLRYSAIAWSSRAASTGDGRPSYCAAPSTMIACEGRASSRREASQTCTKVTDRYPTTSRVHASTDSQREPDDPSHARDRLTRRRAGRAPPAGAVQGAGPAEQSDRLEERQTRARAFDCRVHESHDLARFQPQRRDRRLQLDRGRSTHRSPRMRSPRRALHSRAPWQEVFPKIFRRSRVLRRKRTRTRPVRRSARALSRARARARPRVSNTRTSSRSP